MSRIRHRRGWIGELLNNRAAHLIQLSSWTFRGVFKSDGSELHTFLEYLGAIDFDQAEIGILILLAVTHGGGETALLRARKVEDVGRL